MSMRGPTHACCYSAHALVDSLSAARAVVPVALFSQKKINVDQSNLTQLHAVIQLINSLASIQQVPTSYLTMNAPKSNSV